MNERTHFELQVWNARLLSPPDARAMAARRADAARIGANGERTEVVLKIDYAVKVAEQSGEANPGDATQFRREVAASMVLSFGQFGYRLEGDSADERRATPGAERVVGTYGYVDAKGYTIGERVSCVLRHFIDRRAVTSPPPIDAAYAAAVARAVRQVGGLSWAALDACDCRARARRLFPACRARAGT